MAALNIQLKLKESDVLKPVNVATDIYNVSGLLGTDEKIVSDLLPTWLVGGMKFISIETGTVSVDTLFGKITTWLDNKGITSPSEDDYDNYKGKYFQAGVGGVKITKTSGGIYEFISRDDVPEGSSPNEMELEAGDWFVYNHYDSVTGKHYFGVVNNTYQDSRENQKGVIQLATQNETDAGTNDTKAITPKKLAGSLSPIKGDITHLQNNKQSGHISLTALTQLMNAGSTPGFIRKTGQNTYEIDEKVYTTSDIVGSMIDGAIANFDTNVLTDKLGAKANKNNPEFTGTIKTPLGAGWVKSDASGVLSISNSLVTGLKGNAESTYRTGNVNITKANIGLGNVADYAIANDTDVTVNADGIDNKYMTPLKTWKSYKYSKDTLPVYSTDAAANADLDNIQDGKLIAVII